MDMTRDEFVLMVKRGAIFYCVKEEQTMAVMMFLKDCGFPLYREDEGEGTYTVDPDYLSPGCDLSYGEHCGGLPMIAGYRNRYVEKFLSGENNDNGMDEFNRRHPSGIIPYEKIAKLISGEERFSDEAHIEEDERERDESFLTLLTATA